MEAILFPVQEFKLAFFCNEGSNSPLKTWCEISKQRVFYFFNSFVVSGFRELMAKDYFFLPCLLQCVTTRKKLHCILSFSACTIFKFFVRNINVTIA